MSTLSLSLSLSSFYSSLFPFDKESNYLGLFSDTHTYIHIQRYFKYLCTVFITLMYRIKPSYMHIYVYRKYRYIGGRGDAVRCVCLCWEIPIRWHFFHWVTGTWLPYIIHTSIQISTCVFGKYDHGINSWLLEHETALIYLCIYTSSFVYTQIYACVCVSMYLCVWVCVCVSVRIKSTSITGLSLYLASIKLHSQSGR